ncbi:MAG: 2Fe-2S iron-sulfur cluster-binding protein, partial [Candidatus Latescibacteria bacterium]|nr:2Fe-2S iron-sulfur cluster-binding protein [Candidatus Latescibacterota bacterium]
MPKFTLRINKKTHRIDIDADTPLLWVLRDELGYTGTKYGCGRGLCGACTIHVDGEATRSCMTAVDNVDGAEITTIEGLSIDNSHPIQKSWISEEVSQC